MREESPIFKFDEYDETKLKPEDRFIFYNCKRMNLTVYQNYHPFKYWWYILIGRKKDIMMGRIDV